MPVYKDECVFTFDNQQSPYGVDVCLTCHIGTSPDPQHNFTEHHYRTTGHSAYLNLRKIAKEPTKNDTEHQPKKLAIQEADENDKFDKKTEFKSFSQESEADFKNAIEMVLNADSYTTVKQNEAWELEIYPCEHVAIYESLFDEKMQTPPSTPPLSHCTECDLDKNLWICLECGNLACGRRQFDGSGGNGHALTHFELHNHPLAVKLGSITPEGNVDVYCYACNDDTKDPNIKRHLAYWGIDIASHVKTEKSMTELQLEQNISWDFTAGENGEVVNGNGYTGLKNLGNSCYMNSILQCLFGIPEFAYAFTANDASSNDKLDPEDLRVQLNKIKDGLTSGRYEVVAPQMFKYLVGKDHDEFATARQQDAFEYLSYLLTKVSQQVDSKLPAELFGFQTERRIMCTGCEGVRYISENEESISVAVPIQETSEGVFQPVNLTELLDIYTREEDVEIKCPNCENNSAVSSMKFKTFPKVLIINARRFRIVNWVPQKVDVPVLIPSQPLNLDKYLSSGPQPNETIIDSSTSSETESQVNPVKLDMLQSMGFEKDVCILALKAAHERGYGEGDFDAAVEMIISGEAENSTRSFNKESDGDCDLEAYASLTSMGFSEEQAKIALQQNSNNVEAAIEWLFEGKFETYIASTPTTTDSKEENICLGDPKLPANYEMSSVVCHKGSSVHVGHYVAARCENNQMYLYNDEKVSKGTDAEELQKFAYIYMFRRI